jgi:hypothetical protein
MIFNPNKWYDIPGYCGIYQVNTQGQVKSNTTHSKGKLLTLQKSNGYHRVTLYKNRRGKHCAVHRLVAETFLSNTNKLSIVNHKDGDKINNHIDNLEWVTQSDNMKHAWNSGFFSKSEIVNDNILGEVWKPINLEGFEHYQISNYGRLKNGRNNFIAVTKYKYTKTNIVNKSSNKRENVSIHRLVAHTFLETPTNYSELVVNHIDENKLNNHVDNLEWVTHSENSLHSLKRPVIVIEENGYVHEFDSHITTAKYLGVSASHIGNILSDHRKPPKGFILKRG